MKHSLEEIITTTGSFSNEAIFLTTTQKEAAQKIIEALDGLPITLAAETLKFCEKAIQLTVVDV